MGPTWADYIGPFWAVHIGPKIYGRCNPHWAHMGLLSGPHTGPLWAAHMGLSVWDPYGQARIHHTRGPYGLAIWVSN